jgi:hypothetical protein
MLTHVAYGSPVGWPSASSSRLFLLLLQGQSPLLILRGEKMPDARRMAWPACVSVSRQGVTARTACCQHWMQGR